MDLQEALSQGEAHLKYAMDLAKQTITEDLLFRWDNQITALDDFLADTEVLKGQNPLLARIREQLLASKKKLTSAVMAWDAKQEGESFEEEEIPEEEEAEGFLEIAQDMLGMASEALENQVQKVEELVSWEEPLHMINGFLADSEPLQEINKDLRRARSVVRAARRDLKGRIDDVMKAWRDADRKSAASDDE